MSKKWTKVKKKVVKNSKESYKCWDFRWILFTINRLTNLLNHLTWNLRESTYDSSDITNQQTTVTPAHLRGDPGQLSTNLWGNNMRQTKRDLCFASYGCFIAAYFSRWREPSLLYLHSRNLVVKNVVNNSTAKPTGIDCLDSHTCVIRNNTSCVILTRHPTWQVFPVTGHITVHCGYFGSVYRSSSCCMLPGNHTLKQNSSYSTTDSGNPTWTHL